MADMWMVRAGENGYLADDFKELNIVSIGWEIEDLTDKRPEEIKEIMKKKYPNANKNSLGVNSGQVIRFVCDFKKDDYVITYDSKNKDYLVGRITSDYYYSDKLAKKHDIDSIFYPHFHDVEWIGKTKKDDLSENALKPLKSAMTIFNLHDSAKNEILWKMNRNKIEWREFYIELADKLLEFKDNKSELIEKIKNIYSNLNMDLPTLERDDEGNEIEPYDIDPFTVFALFNKHISAENRIKIVDEFKKEFSLKNESPVTFHGIAVVNNLKATFYWSDNRGDEDIDNLWNLFENALKYNEKFNDAYDKVIMQKGIRWNITMGLNWVKPNDFINLDSTNREFLSNDNIFSKELKEEIKSLKNPPKAEQYLNICSKIKSEIKKTNQFNNFAELSLQAYFYKHYENIEEGIGDNDIQSVKYWLISPGQNAKLWDEFYKDNIIGIGMTGTGDLNQYASKEELKNKFQEIYNDNSSHMHDVHGSWQFVHDIKIGDVIFVKKGMGKIIGRGIVESDYEYNLNHSFHNIRKVKWTHKGNWSYNQGKLPMKTITDITNYQEMVNNINEFFDSEDISVYPLYSAANFLEEVYINEEEYNTLIELVKNKKNIIIEGAPGVGKTFMAKRLAYSIMGVKDFERVMMVQFHQSYSYEDFIMGYRPSKEGFELKQGAFYTFCKKAEEDSENDYFFIIDEINRGNLSKIFGELFMLIEADKRGEKNKIQLVYNEELFFIPKNLYIIGLMNTADRSLAMIDYALRRRFAFFNLKPGFESEGFKEYQSELLSDTFNELVEVICELNEDIGDDESLGEGFRIGHSYLSNIKPENVEDKIKYIINYELIPLLKEYWFDDSQKVEEWSDKLRSVINDL